MAHPQDFLSVQPDSGHAIQWIRLCHLLIGGMLYRGGKMYTIMSSNRAELISDFHPTVRAEWEHSDKPRSGLRTVEAQSGHSVRDQFSSEIEISFPFFCLRSVQHHGIRPRDHPRWRGYRCPV